MRTAAYLLLYTSPPNLHVNKLILYSNRSIDISVDLYPSNILLYSDSNI